VAEAADVLGITQDAVRKRIARETIAHDRGEDGRVFVYLAPSETVHKTGQDTRQDDATKTVQDAYIRSLEDQRAFLRQQLERRDAILLNLTERIPGLEPRREEPSESVEPGSDRSTPPDASGEAQEATELPQGRSWWRRMFGG
jgi:hypothetical protein